MTAKYIIKILTLGDTLVGKSSIVLRFSDNRFDDNQLATIGIDYKTKYIKVKDASVKVLLWDTAGQEKFRNIARQYYKGANGVLLIYDVCDRKTYERIGFWMDELKQNNEIEQLYIILVVDKNDTTINLNSIFKKGQSNYYQARVFYMLLVIVISFIVVNFINDFMGVFN